MEAGENSASPPPPTSIRLKREDYKRTKHDANFSKWQVLIGAYDWEDYSLGKEGAARYRVHNLPSVSAPGLYELGVAVSRSGSGRDVGKLDPDEIVVVYLGQADNVRSRLQRYGRSGAHLGNCDASGQLIESTGESPRKGSGLFEEIFSIGHSIVFRWASMKDKRNALRTEAQLLDTFDYAWNKGSNVVRRPNDIIRKLGEISSRSYSLSRISKSLPFLRPGQVGIKIEAEECSENGKSFLNGIFKLSRWQPRLVSDKCSINGDPINICGIVMSDGITCREPVVPGRKRCKQHKGMRIYGLRTKSIAQGNSSNDQHQNTACGVNLGDGNFCSRQAVPGRKRCEEHKGMKVSSCVSKSKSKSDEQFLVFCGANLGNGSSCRRQPVRGNKRCWQHKGRRGDKNIL